MSELKPLTEAETTELLDWVSACQSSYHINSTPDHRFGGLGSHLQENRDALVECVNALIAARAQPAQAGQVPELTSTEVNDACWAFVEALPHQLPGAIFNDLKPAIYAAICKYLEQAVLAKRVPQWTATSDQMPKAGLVVLACYVNDLGNLRRIRALWVAAKTSESSMDSDCGEYDEATDTYYDPEGWYECIDNWDEYSSVYVCATITHWMPLPPPPGIVGEKGGA